MFYCKLHRKVCCVLTVARGQNCILQRDTKVDIFIAQRKLIVIVVQYTADTDIYDYFSTTDLKKISNSTLMFSFQFVLYRAQIYKD